MRLIAGGEEEGDRWLEGKSRETDGGGRETDVGKGRAGRMMAGGRETDGWREEEGD